MLARTRALAAATATAGAAASRRWSAPAWALPPRWSLFGWGFPPVSGCTAVRPSVVAHAWVARPTTPARPPRGRRVAAVPWAGSGCCWVTGAPPPTALVVGGGAAGGRAVAMAPRRRGARAATAAAVATAAAADPPANGGSGGDGGGGSGDGGGSGGSGGSGGDGGGDGEGAAAAAAASDMATTTAAAVAEAPRRGGRRSVTAATKRGKAATAPMAPASDSVADEGGETPPTVAEEEPPADATDGVDTRPPGLAVKADRILSVLKATYPTPPPSFLDHTDAYTLLVAVLLSARNLDVRVNQVTPSLFAAAPTPAALAAMTVPEVLDHIRTLGLAPQKADALVRLGRQLVENHGGIVPSDEDALTALPGVGNKTAAVVRCLAFGVPTFPVDTHILRLSNRWGLTTGTDTDKASIALQAAFPDRAEWHALHLRLILFGREHCPALRHDMDACPICSWAATTEAVAANRRGGKFVPVAKHAAPWAIRGPRVNGVAADTAAPQATGGDPTIVNSAAEAPPVAKRESRKAASPRAAARGQTRASRHGGAAAAAIVTDLVPPPPSPVPGATVPSRPWPGAKAEPPSAAATAEAPATNVAGTAASAAAPRATRGRRRKSSPPPPLVADAAAAGVPAGEVLVAAPGPSNAAPAAVVVPRVARGRKRKGSPPRPAANLTHAVDDEAAPLPCTARGRKRMVSAPPPAVATAASYADAVASSTAAEPAVAVGAMAAEVFRSPELDGPLANNVDAVAVEVFGSPLRNDVSGGGDASVGHAAAADGEGDSRRGHDDDGEEGGMGSTVSAPVATMGAVAAAAAAGSVPASVGGRRGRARAGLAAKTSTGPAAAKVAAGDAAAGKAAAGKVAAAKATTGQVAAKATPARRAPRRGAVVPPAPHATPPANALMGDAEGAGAGAGGGGATSVRRSGRSRAGK